MLDFIFRDWVVFALVGILSTIGYGALALNDFKIAKACALLATAEMAGGTVMWGINTPQGILLRLSVVALCSAVIGICLVESMRYISKKENIRTLKDSAITNDISNNKQSSLPVKVPQIIIQQPSLGNLKERTLALSDSIMQELYNHGWPLPYPISPEQEKKRVKMPHDKEGDYRWTIARARKFRVFYSQEANDLRNEYAQLHIIDSRLDELLKEEKEYDRNGFFYFTFTN